MVHVDEVWDQLGFRTPWSRGREREEVRKALDPVRSAWHDRPEPATVLATEQDAARRGDAARRSSGSP